jgi:hypothetical protein
MFISNHITKLIATERADTLRSEATTQARRSPIGRPPRCQAVLSLRRRPRVTTAAWEER